MENLRSIEIKEIDGLVPVISDFRGLVSRQFEHPQAGLLVRGHSDEIRMYETSTLRLCEYIGGTIAATAIVEPISNSSFRSMGVILSDEEVTAFRSTAYGNKSIARSEIFDFIFRVNNIIDDEFEASRWDQFRG